MIMKNVTFAFICITLCFSGCVVSTEKLSDKATQSLEKGYLQEAFMLANKAIQKDETNGSAYLLRAKSWFGLPEAQRPEGNFGCADIQKAKELGEKVNEDMLFFYGCK
jgi:hypothetical protein